MRAPVLIASMLGIAVQLVGCADPKAASEANFRKALEPIVRDRFCNVLDVDRMQTDTAEAVAPWPLIVPVVALPSYHPNREAERQALEDAWRGGLLARRTETVAAKQVDSSEPLSTREVIVYTPTDKGKDTFRAVDRRTRSGTREFPGVCGARAEVVNVVSWTDPAEMFGQTLTEVTYTYRGTDPSSIVPTEQIDGLDQVKEAKATLVSASDGWQPFVRR